jgi:hypothetical protein
MSGAASKGRLGAKTLALALALLGGCLLLTACPPDGGDLVPVPPVEGASIATRGFEGDMLVVTRLGVTLRARGNWSVADAATSVILEASNANAEPAVIDFGRGELSRGGEDGGRMILRSVARAPGSGGPAAFLPDKRAEVGGSASDTFVLEFKADAGDGRSGVVRDVTGQTATLRLPVEVSEGQAADFAFGFKYEARRTRR